MSISYSIVFGTKLEFLNIGSVIEKIGFQCDPLHGDRNPPVSTLTYFKEGLLVDLIEANNLTKDIFKDELSIYITHKVIVSVPDDISYKDNDTKKMLELLVGLLFICDDLAFLFNGEKVLFLKNKDGLEMASNSVFWIEENQVMIQEFSMDYRLNKLPVI